MSRTFSAALIAAALVATCPAAWAEAHALRAEEAQAAPRPDAAAQAEPEAGQRRAVPRAEAPKRSEPDTQRRQATPRREPPRRVEMPPRYRALPRVYYFPPIDVRLGFYYHPYFGFYHGPYYGPYYPYPGPFVGPSRYSASAIRTRVRPAETEVYVNGYYAGLADDFDGVFQRLYLPAGEHVVELRLAGYQSFRQQVYVGPGNTSELNHQMRPLRSGETDEPPPPPRAIPQEWTEPLPNMAGGPVSPFGILAVRVEPADAQIYVDGEAWSAAQDLSEFVIHLPAGWHQLEVRKQGYQPFTAKLELSEGQTSRLGVKLEP